MADGFRGGPVLPPPAQRELEARVAALEARLSELGALLVQVQERTQRSKMPAPRLVDWMDRGTPVEWTNGGADFDTPPDRST